ncbi:MAG: HAMP domain-containing histidine kinase [Roseiflexaceae bacterium]|nr:HAMP domain-containing histidine kinase [Roseiflexaceae bacterium]
MAATHFANTSDEGRDEGVVGSVQQIEHMARAHGDVLLHGTQLNSDELVRTAVELAQLADYLAQVSAARSEFLSKVAHELRTPLTIVKGWMSMLRYGDLPPDQVRVVEVVDTQIDDLTRLVGDLLDLSRRESDTLDLRLEQVDLIDLVGQVAEHQRELTEIQGISIAVRSRLEAVYACADRGRIAQVLNNLIANACRYVPQLADGRIELIVGATESAAQITVRDNGIGIAAEHLPRIFEPFYQIDGRKRGKSGLGLAVTNELVRAHGGSITVDSEVGRGTSFHIWLRRSQPGVKVVEVV